MSEELKPCPFCGEVVFTQNDGNWWMVQCLNDFCPIRPKHQTMGKKSLFSEWNHRASHDSERERLAAVEKELAALKSAIPNYGGPCHLGSCQHLRGK